MKKNFIIKKHTHSFFLPARALPPPSNPLIATVFNQISHILLCLTNQSIIFYTYLEVKAVNLSPKQHHKREANTAPPTYKANLTPKDTLP